MRYFLCCFVIIASCAPAQSKLLAIRCGMLIDGRSEAPMVNAVILIEDNRITEVGPNLKIPDGVEVIDLSHLTVLPGLIDCHTHLLLHGGSYDDQILKESQSYRAILGTVAARQTLEAGFTTIRDVETEGAMCADVDLRDAIDRGIIPGPRIFASTRSLSITGGYSPYGYAVDIPHGSQLADGVDGVTKAVREQIQCGADWIKIYGDSRYLHRVADSLVGSATFNDEEMRAIVHEAEKVGIHVCAHCYTSAAAERALRAGVMSIEHGLYLTDETFRLMNERKAYWVPTLCTYVHWAHDSTNTPDQKKMIEYSVRRHKETFGRGLKAGVTIAFGSDFYDPHGGGTEEFGFLVDYGMAPMKAIQAATSVASRLLGMEGALGVIAPGGFADIIAVEGNPLENIRTLEHVRFVMKNGTVYKKYGD